MRTDILSAGVTLTYPDEHCYIFNPVMLTVVGVAHGEQITVKVGDTSICAYSWRGTAAVDVSNILQSLFSSRELSLLDLSAVVSDSKTAKLVSYSVSVGAVTRSYQSLCVWGALQVDYGEMLSGDFNFDYSGDFLVGKLLGNIQNVVWADKLPCSISIPMRIGDKIQVGASVVHTSTTSKVANLSLVALAQSRSLVGDFIVQLKSSTGVLKREYKVLRQEQPRSRIYLRWIDKKGYYCYWAFEKGSDAFDSEKQGVFITSLGRPIDYEDGFNGGDGRQQGKTSKRSITIVEPLCNMSIWNYLLGVTQSPIVDLYTDSDYLGKPRYVKADVATGKIAREARELADFVVSIELPNLSNQSL